MGDLDLLATGPGAEAALDRSPTSASPRGSRPGVRTRPASSSGWKGLQVDLRALPKESYGAALQYFTGSKEHSIALRQRAHEAGPDAQRIRPVTRGQQRERGGRDRRGRFTKRSACLDPAGAARESAARSRRRRSAALPKLVELRDIRGDLHMHTTETDGRATLEEMAEAARALGYEYIAITDHSKALAMANGLDEKRAVAFAQHVREMDRSDLGIRVFSGLECDIRRDGAMDLEDDALANWIS